MGQSLIGIHIEFPKIPLPSQKKSSKFITLINKFICYNQGKYIEYEYLLGLQHRNLKIELNKDPSDKDRLREKAKNLVMFIKSELDNIVVQNFNYMIDYFDIVKKSEWHPRVCVKTAHDDKIVDGFRNNRGGYVVTGHSLDENTGFKKVVDSGIWYIENDIPTEAKSGAYINPRLDDNRVRTYTKPIYIKLNREKADRRWMACWSDDDDGAPASHESCYKSTMIIPMTLKRNDLSGQFNRSFFKGGRSKDRSIWGFLCFDHPATNYFSEEMDMRVGYIFADILSLYYLSAFIHTEISETFSKTWANIGDKQQERRQLDGKIHST